MPYILWLKNISSKNLPEVGGKNASLGELITTVAPQGILVPGGFVVTAPAYRYFLKTTGLDTFIKKTLAGLDTKNLKDLALRGKLIRDTIHKTPLTKDLKDAIINAYTEMDREYGKQIDVAVRSSATAEDLPGASFAGEHETYLGVRGGDNVAKAVVWAFASLFTDRAISYRQDKGFAHTDVALSVGVQKMVRSDKGSAGVMFTVDTDTGFRDVVQISAAWGLGEIVVQGRVNPDEYLVFKSKIGVAPLPIIGKTLGAKEKKVVYVSAKKTQRGFKQTKTIPTTRKEQGCFVLTDREIVELARAGRLIEEHFSAQTGTWCPMDIEWAKDGETGKLYIVQARPETVQSVRDFSKIREYEVAGQGRELVRGISVGGSVVAGPVRVILSPRDISKFKQGEILVTTMTDPDWEPIMKRAKAIITDHGGRTSHAAIVSRELGIPAIVGTGTATRTLKMGMTVTIDTTDSTGIATLGKAKVTIHEHDVGTLPRTRTKIMVNIASPDQAFKNSFLPVTGVGLAREEFIIASTVGIHPLAIINYKKLPAKLRADILQRTAGWDDPIQFYIDNLAYGIAKISAAFAPRPVIVRFSDFKTNEYASLLGGEFYETKESNPMIGWRGASRYYDPKFKKAFVLECRAIAKVRGEMGLDNVIPMIPFCRTVDEAKQVLAIMAENGLVTRSLTSDTDSRSQTSKTTPVYLMCEIPSNVLLADKFFDLVDGMSIGSNDLTMLTLGLDRDAETVSHVGDENDEAVRALISSIVRTARARGKYLGICGQGPSDLPDFAAFLAQEGIESISLNPDSVIATIKRIAEIEEKM